MIKTVGELRVRLEGKTERTAIESILNGATIAAMKGYIAAERYDICTGRNLVKADYVKALTSVVYSLVPEENSDSVADKNVLSFFNSILASNIDTEKYVRVFASMCLYEKITSTSEPHKFSNLPEAEIRMMLGFEANYVRLGDERGMYGLFTNDLNTVNVEDTAKAAKYFVELVHSVFQADYDKATGHNSEITTSATDNDNATASQPANVASSQSETTAKIDLPAKFLNADNKSAFDTRLSLLEKLPLSVLTDFAHNELIDTAGISAEKMPAYVRLILNERLSNIARGLEVTDNGIAIQTPLLSLYRESRGFLPANIRFRVATQYYGTDKNGVKHVVFIEKRQPDTVCAGLVYDGNSHKVYGTAFDFAVRVRNGVEEITYFKFGCPGATEDLEFTVSANAVEPDYDDPDYPGYKPAIQSEIRYEPLYKRDFGISSRITASAGIAQSEVLYMDDSYSDAPGDNSCPDMDIPEAHIPEETPAPVKANQHEEKFLQCRSISATKEEITAMLNKYAEINGTVRVIRDGIKTFRKYINMGTRQGLSVDGLVKAIKEVREKYREWRIEGFKLRLKLLRVMSVEEIRRACEEYIARCEEIRRRHMRK